MPHTPEQKRLHRQKPEVKAANSAYGASYRITNLDAVTKAQQDWLSRNPHYHASWQRRWKTKNPEAAQRAYVRKRAIHNAKLEMAAGRPRPEACDICAGAQGGIVFDHCHQQKRFRGWICARCNKVLGQINDDPTLLHRLAEYLAKPLPSHSGATIATKSGRLIISWLSPLAALGSNQ